MKLKTFFEKFDLFADAPDAVAKMRELVLDLAVKGKLTDRDLKKESVASKYTAEPFSAVLPANWRLLNFGKFCDIQGGNQPPKSQFSDEPRPGYVRMFQIRDLGERPVPVYISKESTSRFCREGEILIGRYGASVGKVFWAQDGAYNVALAKFIFPEDALLPEFAFWVLKSDFFQAEIAGASRSAQAGFNKRDLAAIDFPLPPLAEQTRIVAKVDELMALCDRLEAQQQEREARYTALARASLARFADAPTPANLQFLFHSSFSIHPSDLRKSILTFAFAGKLVPQVPYDEPASVLLEKARAEKARLIDAGLVKKEPWADKLRNATTLYDLPPGWEWTHVSDVVEKVTVGFVGSMKEHYRDGGVPFLRCQNVRVNRYEPIGLTFISKEFHRSISKSTLRPGDVVVTRSGNVGVTCVIPDSVPEANCSDLVIVKRPLALIPSFLSYFINSIAAGQIEAKTVGIALTHFNTQSVAQMTVALPPLAEQRRIVAKVDQLMALVDALEMQLAASRATAANLLSALVAELTAQA